MYAYSQGNRSARGIERKCREDVAYKVITSMRVPDHSTIAEFRRRHESEIAELFEQVRRGAVGSRAASGPGGHRLPLGAALCAAVVSRTAGAPGRLP